MPYMWDQNKQMMVWVEPDHTGDNAESLNSPFYAPPGYLGNTSNTPTASSSNRSSEDGIEPLGTTYNDTKPQLLESVPPNFVVSGAFQYPAASSQEQELLQILLDRAKYSEELRKKNAPIIQNLLDSGYEPSAQEKADIEAAVGAFHDTRSKGLDKSYTDVNNRIRAKFAAQGILDSSIYGDTAATVEKNRAEAEDTVNKDTALFRLSTSEQIREARRRELLQKIGVLQQEENPALTQSLFNSLAAQRSAEASALLQYALGNASDGGTDWTSILLGGTGAAIGGYLGGGSGAMVGYGIGSNVGSRV